MSPEQACGRDVDGRSDVYGLGCAMYHLMTGKLPFPGSSPIERLGKRISGRHVPITEYLPDVPSTFVRVLDKMMAHKPHERFSGAAEAAEALQSLIRPRAKVLAAAPARAGEATAQPAGNKAAPVDAPAAPEMKAPAPAPAVVKVEPTYPAWFAPLARFAEQRPRSALAGAILTVSLTFVAGLVVGLVLK
jgi:serine/threonine-protein kinase